MVSNAVNQITEKQHFVPKFYLRKFANKKNKLERLDLQKREIIIPRGSKGLCCENFFYGIETGTPDELSQQIEQFFKSLENWIARNFDALVGKILNCQHILEAEKWQIAFLMSMLWIRGAAFRRQINRMSQDVYKKVLQFHVSHPYINKSFDNFDKHTGQVTPPEMRKSIKESILDGKFSLNFNNAHHLRMFDSLKGFANCFLGQHWTVYISKSDKKFITSDNPLTVVLPERKGFYGPGILERIHYFPLTPDILIVASYLETGTTKSLRRKTLFSANDQEILDLNMITTSHALQYVYAKDKQSLEDILREISSQEKLLTTTRDKLLRTVIVGSRMNQWFRSNAGNS